MFNKIIFEVPIWKCQRYLLGIPLSTKIPGSKVIGELVTLEEAKNVFREIIEDHLKQDTYFIELTGALVGQWGCCGNPISYLIVTIVPYQLVYDFLSKMKISKEVPLPANYAWALYFNRYPFFLL